MGCGCSVPWGPNHITLQGTFASGANERITCNLSGQRPIDVCNGMFGCMQAQNVEGTIVFDTRNATAHVDTYSIHYNRRPVRRTATPPSIRASALSQMQTQ